MITNTDVSKTLASKLSPVALAVALTVPAISFSTFAQDAEVTEEQKYEAITVTATKRPQVIYEVPIAISAFDGDMLAEQGITDLTDVGKFVPNLNVTGFSAGHTSSVNPFIRGIGLQDHLITTDPGVSVYVDGVYLGRQVGQNWSLNNIERIEVLRGPQGTLYGRNSIGGAINIITKEPDQGDVTKVNAEFGTRGRVKTDLFVNHALSDTLAFNMNLAYNTRDGLGEFINVPNAEYDVGETEDISGRISVKFEPSDDFRMVLTADANNGDGGLRPYTVLIDEMPEGRFYAGTNSLGLELRNTDVTPEGYDIYDNATGTPEVTSVSNEARGVSLTTEWDISDDYTAKVVASRRTSKYKAGLDDDGTIYSLDQYPERGEADQTSIEVQLNGYINEYTDFVAGLYYFNEEGSNRQGSDSSFDGGGNTLQLDQETTSKAVYLNLRHDLTDELSVSGGIRYTEDEKDASANVFDALGTIYDANDWDEVTWELATNYTFENGMTGYATIQNGYQSGQYPARPYCLIGEFFGAGGFDDLDNAVAAVNASNCFVASDNITAVNYEVGVKGRVNEYFDVSVAVFNTEFEDLPYQVSRVSEGGFDTANLVVEQTSRGIELDTTLNVGNFSMLTSIGYMDVEVDEQDGFNPVAPLTPDLTFAIGPSYTFDLEGGDKIRARIDYSYRADMYGEPSSEPARMTEIESRELVNFDVAYTPADEAYTVALYGRNIFDERYDNARLNTGDYILQVLSNDASEFGVRFSTEF
ncbi:TonB-dependent receptor [Alteromonas stellipolaris]|uniref:TonB-dependent receptor n=1 Tax=Alteromonas stellipolaris TaxID=233316 RepID=UPI0007701E1D|nr:TonB-dependent receptor [Alteromonas stellipolaris]AMJ95607.1 TonB-dependent receptor [Alteromonas stellipolaris]MDO6534917.1 TonB-dependent receptor [Alteromonas stellipolaris]MDO6626794.1 TonB-dependent receptor [Alteromonas stellipolaris]